MSNGDCAFAWMPVLMIENSKVNREMGAAVESLRNENIDAANKIAAAVGAAANLTMRIGRV